MACDGSFLVFLRKAAVALQTSCQHKQETPKTTRLASISRSRRLPMSRLPSKHCLRRTASYSHLWLTMYSAMRRNLTLRPGLVSHFSQSLSWLFAVDMASFIKVMRTTDLASVPG